MTFYFSPLLRRYIKYQSSVLPSQLPTQRHTAQLHYSKCLLTPSSLRTKTLALARPSSITSLPRSPGLAATRHCRVCSLSSGTRLSVSRAGDRIVGLRRLVISSHSISPSSNLVCSPFSFPVYAQRLCLRRQLLILQLAARQGPHGQHHQQGAGAD